MWSLQALQEIQAAPEWQCSILHILFTQKLWTDPGDLQFSSPISIPAPPYTPPSIQHFCNIHIYYITLLCSYPSIGVIQRCTCHSFLNNEMWDITGCVKYAGFNIQSAKHITNPQVIGGRDERGLKKNGLQIHDVCEIKSAETALFFPGLTNIQCSWKNPQSHVFFCFFVFFSSKTHSSVMFQLMSH